MTGIDRKTVRRWCLLHKQFDEANKCDYVKGFGWDALRRAKNDAMIGDLFELRAVVAMLKMECHREKIDYTQIELTSCVGWGSFAAFKKKFALGESRD